MLLKLASPHESVRAKVMQMLSNINVRIKSDQVLRLPVSAIFEQLLSPQVQAIVKNFTIIYLDMGYSRLPLEEKLVLLPKLLTNISLKPLAHQTIILHMVLPVRISAAAIHPIDPLIHLSFPFSFQDPGVCADTRQGGGDERKVSLCGEPQGHLHHFVLPP